MSSFFLVVRPVFTISHGHVQTSLRALQSQPGLQLPLVEDSIRRKKGARYENSGFLICNKVEVYREPTCVSLGGVFSHLHSFSIAGRCHTLTPARQKLPGIRVGRL
jgi:hypothetical protein